MAIQCPYCMHTMDVKGAKPGRFAPHCPSCKRKFALVIPDDPRQEPIVAQMPRRDGQTERLNSAIETALGLEPPPSAKQEKRRAAQPGRSASSAAVTTPPPRSQPREPATTPPARSLDQTSAPPSRPIDGDASSMTQTIAPPGAAPLSPGTPDVTDVKPATPASGDGEDLSGRLGGYEIIYRLGRGGMGSVYLARQLSLDRNVAVKTLLEELAQDPQFIARFTREAYAAAQLVHHNVVQIYDIGEQKRTHFFSMEFVEGKTIAELIKEKGRLDWQEAVAYVVQAARGLRFAHEHGMVHRDIKPENLMVNRHGIVKVADLGLVKVPPSKEESDSIKAKKAAETGKWYDTGTTDFNISMGTPAYMPPEQATDAATVDQRADIYALGCTLYAMVTGRPPFSGKTAEEVITKHLKEQFPPPELIVHDVGPQLSSIIQKMTAKKPEDRYQSMDEVIAALEGTLGVQGSVELTPDEEQTKTLGNCVSWFNNVQLAKVRRTIIRAFFPSIGLLVLLSAIIAHGANKFLWVGGLLGFAILTPILYEIFRGVEQKTILWLKGRAFLFGMRVREWVMGFLLLGMSCLILWSLQLAWPIIMFALAATAAAYGFYAAFDKKIIEERRKPLDAFEKLLRQLRARGISEAAIQQFVCKYSGETWEEFFEALFGYEAKMLARDKWGNFRPSGQRVVGDRGRLRPKFAAWRDPVIAWIDQRLQLWQAAHDQAYLEKIEIARLRAKGYAEVAAKKNARRLAESLVARAADIREDAREESIETLPPPPPPGEAPKPEPSIDREKRKARKARSAELRMPDSGEAVEEWEHLSYFQRRYGGMIGFLFNPMVRLLLGIVLVAGCILWMRQNGLTSPQTVANLVMTTGENVSFTEGADMRRIGDAATEAQQALVAENARQTSPLYLTFLPEQLQFLARPWDGYTAGLAGVILLVSTLFSGRFFGLLVVAGTMLMFLGRFVGVPDVGPMSPQTASFAGGLILCGIAFIFGRR